MTHDPLPCLRPASQESPLRRERGAAADPPIFGATINRAALMATAASSHCRRARLSFRHLLYCALTSVDERKLVTTWNASA